MQLNEINLISYAEQANQVSFVLECDLATALALDGQTLTITSNGQPYKVFGGYSVMSVGVQSEYTAMRCVRKLDDATAQAITSLEARADSSEAAINALLTGEVA